MENNNDNVDDVKSLLTVEDFKLMGLCMLFWFYLSLIPYLMILWIFIRKSDYSSNGSYRLIFHVGITDVYSTLDWTTTCCVMVFNWNPINAALGKNWVADAIDNISFVPTNTMIMMLAIVRLICFTSISLPQKFPEKRLADVLATIVYIYSIVLFLIHGVPAFGKDEPENLTNESDINYIMDLDNRIGCPNYGLKWGLGIFVTYYQMAPLIIANIIYAWCIIHIIKKRYKGTGKAMTSKEWRMFYQTTIPCSFKLFTQFFWYFYCSPTKAGQAAQLLLLVVDNGYHPWFYLIVNKKLRLHVLSIFLPTNFVVTSKSNVQRTNHTQQKSTNVFRILQMQRTVVNNFIRPTQIT